MGALRQIGLLLWKNILRKKRQPTLFALELIWPTAIFLVIALVRLVAPPVRQETCHYQPRYMPSAGGVEFIQSFVCNVNNECRGESQVYEEARSRMDELMSALGPLMSDPNTTRSLLLDLPKTTAMLSMLTETLSQPRVQELIHQDMRVGNLFRNEAELERYLTSNAASLTQPVAESLMDAKVNLKEMYELTGFIDLQGVVCDPEKLSKYLIFSAQVDVEAISRNLCSINESLIPNITNTLRDQIDVSKILRISSKLMKLAEEYTVADGLLDLADLVEVVSNQDSVRNFTDAYIQLGMTSTWLGSVADFVEQLNGTMGSQIVSFSKLLNSLDPLVKNFSGDSGLWQQAQIGYNYLKMMTDWTAGGPMKLPDTTGVLWELAQKEPALINQVMTIFNFSESASKALLNSRVNTTRISRVLMEIKENNTLKELCEGDKLASIFVAPMPKDTEIIRKALEPLCKTLQEGKPTSVSIGKNLTDAMVALTMKNSAASERLNWTEVVDSGTKIIDQVRLLSPQLSPILDSVQKGDLQEVWDSGATLLSAMMGVDNNVTVSQGQIFASSSLLEGILRGQAVWPYVRMGLIAANISMDVVEQVLMDLPRIDKRLSEQLKNNSAFGHLVEAFDRIGSENSERIINLFIRPDTLEMLMYEPEKLERYLCDENQLEAVIDAKTQKKYPQYVRDVKTAVCDENLAAALHDFILDTGILKMEQQISMMVGVLDGSIDSTSPEWEQRANITQFALRLWEMTKLMTPQRQEMMVDWNKVLGDSGLMSLPFGNYNWHDLMKRLEQSFSIPLLRAAFIKWGEIIESSTLWTDVELYFQTAYAAMKSSNTQMNSMDAFMSDSGDFGILLQYMMQYGADMTQAFADIINDPQQRKLLFVAPDPIGLFCLPLPVGDVMTLRPEVPIDAIQLALCNVEPSDIIQPAVDLVDNSYRSSDDTYHREFTWERMFDTANEFITHLATATSDNSAFNQMNRAMETLNPEAFKRAEDSLVKAANSLDEEETKRMDTFYINVLNGLDKRWAGRDDKWWDTVKTKLNVGIDMAKDMDSMMKSLEKSNLDLSPYMSDDTQLSQMLKQVYKTYPDVMDTMMSSILRPEKMMKMMATVDLNENSFCKGDFSLADLMDFKNPNEISKVQDMLCSMDFTEVQKELLNDPVAKKFNDKMQVLMSTERVTKDVSVDWRDMYDTTMATMETMNKAMSDMPTIPGINMEDMSTRFLQIAENYPGDSMQIFQILAMVHDTIYNMSAGAIPEEYNRAFSILQSTLDLLNNDPALNVTGRSLNLIDFVRIPMVERLMDLLPKSSNVTNVVLKALSNTLISPQRVDIMLVWIKDPAVVCSNRSAFEFVLPEITSSGLSVDQIQKAFCDLASSLTAADINQLPFSFTFAVENITKLSQKIESALSGRNPKPDVIGLLTGADAYMNMLSILAANPPSLENIWGDLAQPNVWQSLMMEANRTLLSMSGEDALVNIFASMAGVILPEIPGTEANEMVSDIVQIGAIVNRDMEVFIKKNLTLADLTMNRPETSKVVDLLPKITVVMEVVTSTLFMNPAKIQSSPLLAGNWVGFCQNPAKEQFELSPHLAEDFTNFHVTICSIDFNVIANELSSVINIQEIEKVLNEIGNATVNPLELIQTGMKFQEILTTLGVIDVPFLDFPWLDSNVWTDMFTRLSSTMNDKSLMDSLLEAGMKIVPLLEELFREANATIALNPLIGKATDFTNAVQKELTKLLVLNMTLADVFLSRTQSAFLLNGLNEISAIVDTLVNTALKKPEQLSKFLSGDAESLCQMPLESQVTIPSALKESYMLGMAAFCSANYSAITSELSGLIDFASIQKVVLTSSQRKGNIPELMEASDRLVATLTALNQLHTDPSNMFANPTTWGNITVIFLEGLNKNDLVTNIPASLRSMFPNLWEAIESTLSDMELSKMINTITHASNTIKNQLSPLRMNISITEYLADKPETSKMVRLLPNLPSVLEVVITTSMNNPSQMQELYRGNIYAICETPRSVFTVAPDLSERFYNTITTLCSLKYPTIEKELSDLVNVAEITRMISSDSTIPKASLSELMDTLSELWSIMEGIISRPPTTGPDLMTLFNSAVWSAMWERVATLEPNIEGSVSTAIQGIVSAFEGNLTTSLGLDPFLIQAVQMMRIINTDMEKLIKQNISLVDLGIGRPELQLIISTVPDAPILVETILMTAIMNPQNIAGLMGGDLKSICTIPTSSLSIPEGGVERFRTLRQTLCAVDEFALLQELEGVVRFKDIQEILENQPSSVARANYTALMTESYRLAGIITILDTLPPTIDTSFINQAVWNDTINRLLQLFTNMNSLESLPDNVMSSLSGLEPLFRDTMAALNTNSLVNKADALMSLFIDILNPIFAANLTEDLVRKLQPETQRLVRMLPYAPVLFEVLFNTAVSKPDQAQRIFMGDLRAICLSAEDSVLIVPENVTAEFNQLAAEFCSFDPEQLQVELGQQFNYGLFEQVLTMPMNGSANFTSIVSNAEKLFKMIDQIMNSPLGKTNVTSLSLKLLGPAVKSETWTSLLQSMNNKLVPSTEISDILTGDYVDIINNLLMNINSDGMLDPWLIRIMYIMEYINPKLEQWNRGNLTHNDLLRDRKELGKVIRMLPHIMVVNEVLQLSSILKPDTASRVMAGDPYAFCSGDPEDIFEVPPHLRTAFREVVTIYCSLNFTVLEQEVMGIISVKSIENILTMNVTGQKLNTSRLMVGSSKFAENIQAFSQLLVTGFTFPIEKYMTDFTGMFDRISKYIMDRSPDKTIEDLTNQLLPQMDQLFTTQDVSTQLGPVLSKLDMLLDYLLTQADGLLTMPLSIDSLLATSPESFRLYNLTDKLPTIVEVMLHSVLDESKATQALMAGDLVTFCASGIDGFTVKESQVQDFLFARGVICATNFSKVNIEVMDRLDTETLVTIFQESSSSEVTNITNLSVKMAEVIAMFMMVDVTNNLFPMEFAWINETVWTKIFEGFVAKLTTSSSANDLQAAFGPLNDLTGMLDGVLGDSNVDLTLMSKLLQFLNDELQSLPDKELTFNDLFAGYPEIQRLSVLLPHLPAIVSTMLATGNSQPGKPTNIIQLVTNNPTIQLDELCLKSSSELFEVPVDFEQEIDFAWRYICSLNSTRLTTEFSERFRTNDFLSAFIGVTEQGNATISSIMEQALQLVEMISNKPPIFNMNVQWLNESLWANALMRINSQFSTANADLSASTITAMIEPLFGGLEQFIDFGESEPILEWLRMALDVTAAQNQIIKALTGPLSPNSGEFAETTKIVDLLDDIPGALLSLIQYVTATENSDELGDFIAKVTQDPTLLCQDNKLVPSIGMDLCKVNWTKVQMELGLAQDKRTNNISLSDALMVYIQNTLQTQNTMTEIIENGQLDPRWSLILTPQWMNLSESLSQLFLGGSENSNSEMTLESFQGIVLQLKSLEPVLNSSGLLAQIHASNAVTDVLLTKLQTIEALNRSRIHIVDIFPGSPEIRKLVRLIEKHPGLVEVLVLNSGNQKFYELFSMKDFADTWKYLSSSDEAFKQYIDLPAITDIDLSILREDMKRINPNQLMSEMDSEFSISLIQLSNNGPVDWAMMYSKMVNISNLLTTLPERNISIELLGPWTDENFWVQALSQSSMQYDSYSNYAELFNLLSMSDDPTIASMNNLLNAMVASMNLDLTAWAKENQMSLGTILMETPQLQQVVKAFIDNLPEATAWLLYAPVNNAQKLSELLSSPNIIEHLCSSSVSQISEIYRIPSSVNMTNFYRAICKVNATALNKEVLEAFGLANMIGRIDGMVNGTLYDSMNLTKFIQMLGENSEAINTLINNPPSFMPITVDENKLQEIFDEFLKHLMDSQTQTDQLVGSFKPLVEGFFGPDASGLLSSYMELASIYIDYGNQVLLLLPNDEGKLKLADLFYNETVFHALLSPILPKEISIANFGDLAARDDMVGTLTTLEFPELKQLFCDPMKLGEYFIIPQDMDVTAILTILCPGRSDVLATILQDNLRVPHILKQLTKEEDSEVDLGKYIQIAEGLLQKTLDFFNVSGADAIVQDIISTVNMSMASSPDMWASVMGLTQVNPASFASLAQNLAPLYEGTPFWKEQMRYLSAIQTFMDVVNNKLQKMQGSEIHISTLLKNATYTRYYLQQGFNVLPDVVEVLMASRIDVAAATRMASGVENANPFCTDAVVFPAPGTVQADVDAARNFLCSADAQVMIAELSKEFNIETIRNAFMDASDSSSFNWERYMTGFSQTQELVQWFLTNATLPSPPEFIGYRGNWTAWVMNMEKLFQIPGLNDTEAIAWAGTWASQALVDPMTMRYQRIVASYMNKMVDAVNNRILLPVDLTLKDILVNEPLLTAYLTDTFKLTPTVVSEIMLNKIDLGKLMEIITMANTSDNILPLLCNGVIMNVQISSLVCQGNYDGMTTELSALFDWNSLMEQLAETNNYTEADLQPVDWAEYFMNLGTLQNLIGARFSSPINVTQFFAYRGDLSSWIDRLYSAFPDPEAQMMGVSQLIQNSSSSIQEAVTAILGGIHPLLLPALDTMSSIIVERTMPFADGNVTIDDLLGGSPIIRSQLTSLSRLTERDFDALLQATLKLDQVADMTDPAVIRATLCDKPLGEVLVLPAGDYPNLQDLQTRLCSLDLDLLARELSDVLSIDRIMNEISKIENYQMPNITSSPRDDVSTDGESTSELVDLLWSMIENPPAIAPELQKLFNFTRIMPLLERIMEIQTETQQNILKKVTASCDGMCRLYGSFKTLETYLGPQSGFSEAAFTLNEVIAWVNKQLESLKDPRQNLINIMDSSLNFTTVYSQLLHGLPELQTYIINQLRDKPELNQLAMASALQKLVCNKTAFEATAGRAGIHFFDSVSSLITDSLCGKPASQWFDSLSAALERAGIDSSAMIEVIEMLKTIRSAMGPSRNETVVSNPPFNSDSLEANVKKLIELVSSLDQNNGGMTGTIDLKSFQKMLQNIDLSLANSTLAYVQYQLDYLVSEFYVNDWNIDLLPSAPDLGELGHYASVFLKYLNSMIEDAEASGSEIQLTKIIPDGEKMAELLSELSSPDLMEMFMQATMSPVALQKLMDSTSWEANCRQFARSSNVAPEDRLMANLCTMDASNPGVLQKLADLISLNATIHELQTKRMTTASTWAAFSKQMYRMLENVKGLTTVSGVNSSYDDMNTWALPIMNWVETLTQGPNNTLNDVCGTLDQLNIGSPLPDGTMAPVIVVIEGLMDIMQGLPELEGILCDMGSLNLTGLAERIEGSQIMKGIIRIVQGNSNSTCTNLYGRLMEFASSAEKAFGTLPHTIETAFTCVAKTADKTLPVLMELQGIAGIWNEIQSLIVDFPGFPDFINDLTSDIKPFLDLFLSVLIDQDPVWDDVSNLFVNPGELENYFKNVANITPSAIDAFMTATLDLTELPVKDKTATAEIRNIFCDPVRLSRLLTLQTTELNITTLSGELCTLTSNRTAMQIQESLDIGKILLKLSTTPPEYSMNTTWLTGTLTSLDDIVGSIQNLTGVISIFDEIPSLDAIKQMLPELQNFLADSGPEDLYKDIIEFVGLFSELSENPTANKVLGEIEAVGKKALDAGVFARLINYIDVNIKDILGLEELVIKQLSDLGVDPKVAKTLLDSSFSFVELLNIEEMDIPGIICDPGRLGRLIDLPMNSNVTITQMSMGLCGLDKARVAPVSEALIQNLEVGNLIKDFVQMSPSTFLKDSNMTKEDMINMMEKFKPAKENFKTILKSMDNMTSLVVLSKNATNAEAQTAASSMATMSQLLCGQDSALNIEDEFNINAGAKKDISIESSWTAEEREEMNGLKTEFCMDMYKQIVSSGVAGKVAWSFVKPLIVGTIIYTPDTEPAKVLVQEALWIRDAVTSITELTRAWIDGIGSLNDFGRESENQRILTESLENPFISSAMYEMVGVGGDELLDQLSALEALASGDLETLTMLAGLMHNITECVDIKVEGVPDEAALGVRAAELTQKNSLLGGVVLLNMDDAPGNSNNLRQRRDTGEYENRTMTWADQWLPKHLKYKIRMDTDNVPSTVTVKERADDIMKTELNYKNDGIYKAGPEDNFAEDLRYLRGFLPLEDMLEQAFIKLQVGKDAIYPKVEVQQMPYPCYEKDDFSHYISRYYFPIAMTLAWLFAMGTSITLLMKDKESGMNQLMKVMGLRGGFTWVSWFVPTFVMALTVAGVITFFLKVGQLMRYSNTGIIYLCLVNFAFSTCMMSYFISSIFQRATMASLTGLLIYLMSYLPYIIVVGVHVDMVFWHRVVVSLSSTCAFSYAGQIMSDLEQRGVGIQWYNTKYGYSGFDFRWTQYMMLIDAAIYGFLGWYISHINPGKFGLGHPWYFPFSPSYWGCKKPKNYGDGLAESSRRSKPMHAIDHTQDTKSSDYIDDSASDDTYQSIPHSQGPGEPDPLDLPIGVSLHHLTKRYQSGQRPAVDDLSVNFYQGQITAFLGHNGAGKSTTIHMLTGIFPPTSGTAYVSGYDILAQNSQLKTTLGFCPQHDVLFEHMTVLEHMEFFCKVKGRLNKAECNDEIKIMVNRIGLQEEISTPVAHLSGGQRRRLSVALAFIGGSKVVILDEPTSGVDPSARRLIWDLIIDYRQGRTIVLSTHHLDEAETIGDRIVVLHQGKLVCSGSPLYLKSEYGSGYNLTIAKLQPRMRAITGQATDAEVSVVEECDSRKVLQFIQQYISSARLVEEIGTEMTFMLPTAQGQVQAFRDMFNNLENAKEQLHIHKYGVSDTTLEEIFLKLTKMAERGQTLDGERLREWTLIRGDPGSGSDSGHGTISDRGSKSSVEKQKKPIRSKEIAEVAIDVGAPGPMKGHKKIRGFSLKMRQFRALLTKRFHHNRRDLRTYLSQIILPCLFILFAMGCTLIKPKNDDMPQVLISPELYPQSEMFFRNNNPKSNDTFIKLAIQSLFDDPGVGTACMEPSSNRRVCEARTPFYYVPARTTELPQCECKTGRQLCSQNMREYINSVPHLKTSTKSTLYNLTGELIDTPEYLLSTHRESVNRFGGWTFDMEGGNPKATIWFNNKGHHSLPAFYNALNNMILRANIERSDSNRSAGEYGMSLFNHPLNASKDQLSEFTLLQGIADTGIALTILCAFCFVPAGYIIYLIHERVHQEKQLQMICGVGIVQYWCSAFIWDMLSYLLTVGLTTCIALAFDIPIYTARLNLPAFIVLLILFGYATIPLSYIMVRIFNDVSIGYMTVFIMNLFIGINTTSCTFLLSLFATKNEAIANVHEILQKVLLVLPQYALGDGLVKLSFNQFLSEVFERFELDNYKNPFSFEMVGWHMVAMAIQGTVLFLLTLLTDARGCVTSRSLEGYSSVARKRQNADYREDSDVSLERQRVVTGEARDDLLVLHNLSKVYRRGLKKVLAVENICLGVPKGECFGLLGINGAGKTTTFKMITGNLLPTGGAANLSGKTISEDMSNMEQNVGYCPQQDALDPMLTGTEMIYCLARLKGIPEEDIPEVCEAALHRFGLKQGAKKQVKTYSGGNKRKLSTAIALLGEPEIILLDEPTTGMDPGTRRLVWNNITDVVKDNRSIILTSHSMAECDALCTRLAIMVNGRFKCLGSGQHLKNKFGGTYTVKLRVAGHSINQTAAIDFMNATFRGCYLKSRHHHMLEFEIPTELSSLAELFGVLETEKFNLHVEDYSISQTTLDQLFVNFAEGQTDGCISDADKDNSQEDGANNAYVNRAYDTLSDSQKAHPSKMYNANIKSSSGSLRLRDSLHALPVKEEEAPVKEGKQMATLTETLPEGHGAGAPLRSGAPLRHVPPIVRAEALDRVRAEENVYSEPSEYAPSEYGEYNKEAGVKEMEYIPTENLSIRL